MAEQQVLLTSPQSAQSIYLKVYAKQPWPFSRRGDECTIAATKQRAKITVDKQNRAEIPNIFTAAQKLLG